MTDKETSEGERKTKVHALHRHYNNDTPLSLRVDWQKLQDEKIISSRAVHERLDMLMSEIDRDLEMTKHYNYGGVVFLIIMMIGAFMSFNGAIILWLGGVIGLFYLSYKGAGVLSNVKKKHGFIDGIFFVLTELTSDLQRYEEKLKETTATDDTIK